MGDIAEDTLFQHSKTEFTFRQSSSAEILRVCSYQKAEAGQGIMTFRPNAHDKVRSTLYKLSSRESDSQLGLLDRLPLELVLQIILELDLASVLAFRHVSVRAANAVSSTRQYRLIVAYALDAFCAALRTDVADRITLDEFYEMLCESECGCCSTFAPFIFLPTLDRCCYDCIESFAFEQNITTFRAVQANLDLSETSLAELTKWQTLGGMDQGNNGPLVCLGEAKSAYFSDHKGNPPSYDTIWHLEGMRLHLIKFACAMPVYDLHTGTVFAGVFCKGCRQAERDEHAVPPIFAGGESRHQMAYSRESFLSHFKWCEDAQSLWILSEGLHVKPQAAIELE